VRRKEESEWKDPRIQKRRQESTELAETGRQLQKIHVGVESALRRKEGKEGKEHKEGKESKEAKEAKEAEAARMSLLFASFWFETSDAAKAYLRTDTQLGELSQTRLNNTVEEERERLRRMELLRQKESKLVNDAALLRKELLAEEKTRSAEVQQLRENEQRLSQQITKTKQENKAFLALVASNLLDLKKRLEETKETRLKELKDENRRLEEELLQKTTIENRNKEKETRKSKQQAAYEIHARILQYDSLVYYYDFYYYIIIYYD
jgi:hypothetical protein